MCPRLQGTEQYYWCRTCHHVQMDKGLSLLFTTLVSVPTCKKLGRHRPIPVPQKKRLKYQYPSLDPSVKWGHREICHQNLQRQVNPESQLRRASLEQELLDPPCRAGYIEVAIGWITGDFICTLWRRIPGGLSLGCPHIFRGFICRNPTRFPTRNPSQECSLLALAGILRKSAMVKYTQGTLHDKGQCRPVERLESSISPTPGPSAFLNHLREEGSKGMFVKVTAQGLWHSNILTFSYRVTELFPSLTATTTSTGLQWVTAERAVRHRRSL